MWLGVPEEGVWKVRFNSDWKGYDEIVYRSPAFDVETFTSMKDDQEYSITINLGPY